jgi:hypothetical protein
MTDVTTVTSADIEGDEPEYDVVPEEPELHKSKQYS